MIFQKNNIEMIQNTEFLESLGMCLISQKELYHYLGLHYEYWRQMIKMSLLEFYLNFEISFETSKI